MFSFAINQPKAVARKLAFACAMGAAVAALPSHAATYTELADAGQTLASAQVTTGSGALTNVYGSLLSSTDADLFLINITNPAAFSASTVNAISGLLDTQLFLLTAAGAPVFVNDDDAGGLSFLSTLPAGSASTLTAGVYILGISLSGYDPVNSANQLLFANGLPTSVRGAAFGLQPATLGGFTNNAFSTDIGSYDIQLTGAVAAAVPEPTTGVLFLLGAGVTALAVSRRRAADRSAA